MTDFFNDVLKKLNILSGKVGRLEAKDPSNIALKQRRPKTLSGGAFTATAVVHELTSQTGTTDDLDTINGGTEGRVCVISPVTGHAITAKDSTGNLNLSGGDFIMDDVNKSMWLRYSDDDDIWYEISRAGDAAVGGTGKQYATFVVAADDSTADGKANADYVCDGADDDVQIAAALAAVTPSTFRRVLLLEGTYELEAAITVPANASLEGQGPGTVLNYNITAGVSANLVQMSSSSRIFRLKIDGQNIGTLPSGIYGTGVANVQVSEVWVTGFKDEAINFVSSCSDLLIHNNRIESPSGGSTDGIVLNGANCIITNNHIYQSTRGISVQGANNTIVSNELDSCLDDGIRTFNGSDYCTITGNNTYGCQYGIRLTESEFCTISGNNCQGDIAWLGDYGIYMDGISGDGHNLISGNYCAYNSIAGIFLQLSNYNHVVGNFCIGNSWSSSSDTGVNRSAGIRFDEADHNTVVQNRIIDTIPGLATFSQWGIWVDDSDCDNNFLIDNFIIMNNGEMRYFDVGTNTTIVRASTIGSGTREIITLSGDIAGINDDSRTSFIYVAAETGTADDLDTISGNGIYEGMVLVLRPDAGDTITVKDNIGNVQLSGSDFVMDNEADKLMLIYDIGITKWCEISRANNA